MTDQQPQELADRLLNLIRTVPRGLAPGAPALDVARRRKEMCRHYDEIVGIRDRLATEFGRARGWRLSRSDFAVRTLARGSSHNGAFRPWLDDWPRSFTDHRFFYRSGRQAAALVGHPYGMGENDRASAVAWAEANGLRVTFPDDFPSWWYPGWTQLVVFTPAIVGRGQIAA